MDILLDGQVLDPALVLNIRPWEHDGSVFASDDARGHSCTKTGVTLGLHGFILDGVDDYIKITNPASLSFERTDSFSLMVWYKTTAVSEVLLSKQRDGTAPAYRGWSLELDASGRVRFTMISLIPDYLQVRGATATNDNSWHCGMATYTGTSAASGVKIYLDGSAETQTNAADALASTTINTIDFNIGTYTNGSEAAYFSGSIGEVAIFRNKVLTPSEIQRIYLSNRWRYA